MKEKYLRFLDFILPILSEKYPDGMSLATLAHNYEKETQIQFNYQDRIHFQNQYDNQYFEISGNLDYAIINPETKEINDSNESLSHYLEAQNISNSLEHEHRNFNKGQTDKSEMKHEIFISYSDHDKDKVELIEKELTGNTLFKPLVIANKREALTPLAKKVAEGINNSKVFLPILTTNSKSQQWINQEIGYAQAKQKKIMPIVAKELINTLKGFIHQDLDLPYNFQSNDDKSIENRNFVKEVKNLISDLENEFRPQHLSEDISKKTEFEKVLDFADQTNEEIVFREKKKSFLDSKEGLDSANQEVINMLQDLDRKINTLQKKNFIFDQNKRANKPSIIVKSKQFSFRILWEPKFGNSCNGAFLFVSFWVRQHRKLADVGFLEVTPDKLKEKRYSFDVDRAFNPCWQIDNNSGHRSSSQIVDSCLKWIVKQINLDKLKAG